MEDNSVSDKNPKLLLYGQEVKEWQKMFYKTKNINICMSGAYKQLQINSPKVFIKVLFLLISNKKCHWCVGFYIFAPHMCIHFCFSGKE